MAALAQDLHRCSRCKAWKPASDFGSNRNRPCGLHIQCRPCSAAYAHEDWQRNKAARVARAKARRATAEGKHKRIVWQERRRQRLLALPNTLTYEEWCAIIEGQGGRCLMCGIVFSDALPPTRDHIIPLTKGGPLAVDNVQALCGSCNSRKRARILDLRG